VGGRYILRDDIRYIDAGVMVLPKDLMAQRQFNLMLPKRYYKCINLYMYICYT
jgi:hypothetical protein